MHSWIYGLSARWILALEVAANLEITLLPERPVVVVLWLPLLLVAGILLFGVVTWYRDGVAET